MIGVGNQRAQAKVTVNGTGKGRVTGVSHEWDRQGLGSRRQNRDCNSGKPQEELWTNHEGLTLDP